MPHPARTVSFARRLRLSRAAGTLTRLACLSLPLLTAAPVRADDQACPDAVAAFDANGAIWTIPKDGAGQPLDILAIGSSSTEGIGASAPSQTYPARLEDELAREDGIAAKVKNAGVGGEVAAKTLPRLMAALASGWARLVIWQVGTNDAMIGVDESLFRATVEKGLAAARAAGVPILLMDPQYTTRSPDPARYERFVAVIGELGARNHVPVLSRFQMMKRRGLKNALTLLSGDGLHMNDRGYRCVAHALAEAIETAAGAKL